MSSETAAIQTNQTKLIIEQSGNQYKQKAATQSAQVVSMSLAPDNSVPVQLQRLVEEKNLLEKHNSGSSDGKQLRVPNPQPGPPPPVIENKTWRISNPYHPGWVSLESGYIGGFHIPGAPVELPHTVALFSRASALPDGTRSVKILEGRYKDKDARIRSSALVEFYSFSRAANMTFQKISEDSTNIYGRFSYGSNASVNGIIDAKNPVHRGKHDIEIPDFQHNEYGTPYGKFGTTWFRIGHSGDRYLHPGRVSAGCVTITQYNEWPSIWLYLINSRKDARSVGEIEIK
ncbi:MAG: hypothetical protein RLP12_13540 [Ekhidna sp.]